MSELGFVYKGSSAKFLGITECISLRDTFVNEAKLAGLIGWIASGV